MGASISTSLPEAALERLPDAKTATVAVVVVASVALPLAAWALHSSIFPAHKNLPPGPRPLPILGNLLDLSEAAHLSLTDLAKTYGPVMTVFMGTKRAVFISSPEAVKEAMITRRAVTAGRPLNATVDLLTYGGQDVAFSDGSEWRRRRKAMTMAILHKSQFSKKIPHMQEVAKEMIESIRRKCNGSASDIQPKMYLRAFTMNIIYEIICNQRLDMKNMSGNPDLIALDKAYADMFKELGPHIEDLVPLLHLLPTSHMRTMRRTMKTRDRVLQKWIKAREAAIASAGGAMKPENILDELLMGREEYQLSDTEIAMVVSDIVSAGTDTTSVTLEWMLLLLAQHPEAQAAVHKELDSVFPDGVVPSDIDRSQLPVLTATIMEAMRIKTVGPLVLPHRATEDTEIGGYTVPKDTMIIINLWAMLMDPERWTRPEEFRPARFLEEESRLKLQGAESRPDVDAYKFIPFSVGARYCPGQEMAQTELFLASAHLLRAFEWKPTPGAPIDLNGILGLTYEPKAQTLTCAPRL